MNQTVEFLLPFAKKLIYVDSSADISLLKTKFIEHNVSLLPIIDNKGSKNVGLYKRKVMWSKYANEIKFDEKSLKEKELPEVDVNDNLFHAMDLLSKHSAVLINENNSFSKLITTRVVADALRDYSHKFLSIESLENKLRDIVRALKILHSDKLSDVVESELTFEQYKEFIGRYFNDTIFKKLKKKEILKMIDDSRLFRNDVCHFKLHDNKGMRSLNKFIGLIDNLNHI
jgi:CBS domain-containing protein